MDLKELLGEELYNQLMSKLGDKHKVAIVSDGNWLPKSKFDAVNEEKKQYKEQVDSLNKDLGKLQKQLEDNADATETINTLKQQIADKEAEMATVRKTNAIKLKVLEAGPNDVADILPLLDSDKVSIDDNGVTGLNEQLESLRESKPYLFKEEGPPGTGGSMGNNHRDKTPAQVNSLGDALKVHYSK